MRDSQLEKMSVKELSTLQTRISQAIAEKRISERSEMRAAMEELAKKSGFSLAELFGKGRKGKGIAKYRNPKDPSQTWTGRGRKPNWLLEAGGDPKKYLIT